jgi:hypothetical protein
MNIMKKLLNISLTFHYKLVTIKYSVTEDEIKIQTKDHFKDKSDTLIP